MWGLTGHCKESGSCWSKTSNQSLWRIPPDPKSMAQVQVVYVRTNSQERGMIQRIQRRLRQKRGKASLRVDRGLPCELQNYINHCEVDNSTLLVIDILSIVWAWLPHCDPLPNAVLFFFQSQFMALAPTQPLMDLFSAATQEINDWICFSLL